MPLARLPGDYAPSTTIRTKIPGENAELRRFYVRIPVGDVSVDNNEIVIAGSTTVLEAAAIKGDMISATAVRGFDWKWCRLQEATKRQKNQAKSTLSRGRLSGWYSRM